MKNTLGAICFAAAVLSAGGASAAIDDALICFSTVGPDRYADGSVVADGEAYALVWTAAGATFAGFNADGTLHDPSTGEIVLVAPIAEDGRCPRVNFQIAFDEYAAQLAAGTWAVYLLDTRAADGRPAGTSDGRPVRVNRCGRVESAEIALSRAGALKAASAAAAASSSVASAASGDAVVAREASLLPGDEALFLPRVSAIEVDREGNVVVSVTNTVPYLTYNLDGGPTPGLGTGGVAERPVDGAAARSGEAGTVRLVVPADGTNRFFRVVRDARDAE